MSPKRWIQRHELFVTPVTESDIEEASYAFEGAVATPADIGRGINGVTSVARDRS